MDDDLSEHDEHHFVIGYNDFFINSCVTSVGSEFRDWHDFCVADCWLYGAIRLFVASKK